MTTLDLTQTTLADLRDALADKQLSAEQALGGYLDRIEALDSQLNVFAECYADRALDRARQVDRGEVAGPLAGVPIALKDIVCTDWGRTACSSRMLENFHSPYTATAVARLEQAGAVIVGKTKMDEFAMGSSCENCAFGQVRNPWAWDYVPGGSSGGSAAAVTADLSAAAIGTDTGGSIRQPAALCNVVGLKPTYGRVSRYGLVAFASSFDQIGPMTHTVGDSALMLAAMMGKDPRDSTSADLPVPDGLTEVDHPPLSQANRKLRIGVARQYLSEDSNHPAVNQATHEAAKVYEDLGAEVVPVDLPHTEYGIPAYYILATAEASSNLARYDGVHYGYRARDTEDLSDLYCRSRSEGFGEEVKRRIMLGTYALSSGYYEDYYVHALKVRRLIKQDFDNVFNTDAHALGCDAILCPTTTGPAFKLGEKTNDPLSMYLNDVYTVGASLAGIPAISLPAGFTTHQGPPRPRDGPARLPVGIQLLAQAFDETKLLRIARMYERQTPHWQQRPDLER